MAALTMNVNEFLGSLTNLIVNTRVLQTLGDTVRPIVKGFLKEASPYGDQDRFLSADILPDGDYQENSSLLTVAKPTTYEETISLTDKKKWKVSLTRYLLQGAFTDEFALSSFYNLLVSLLTKTKNVFLYNKAVNALMSWSPTLSTQTIEINVASGATDKEKAEAIYLALKDVYLNMLAPNRKYNDIGYMEDATMDDLVFYANAKYENLLEVSLNAFAYNLSELKKWLGENKHLVPSDYVNNPNANTIGWIWHVDKYQIRPFFDVSTSFFDADNLVQHQYIHSWFKSGYVRALMGVKLVLVEAAETFSVTFDSNGGSTVSALTVTSGDAAVKPTDPTLSGHTFDGWFTDSGLTQAYNWANPVTAAFTLYAKWTED